MLNKVDHSVAASDNIVHAYRKLNAALDLCDDTLECVMCAVLCVSEKDDCCFDNIVYVNNYLRSAQDYIEGLSNHVVAILKDIDMHDVNILNVCKPIYLEDIRKTLEDKYDKLKARSMRYSAVAYFSKRCVENHTGSSDLGSGIREGLTVYIGMLQTIKNVMMVFPDLSNVGRCIELCKHYSREIPAGMVLEEISREYGERLNMVVQQFDLAYSKKSKREKEKNNHDKMLAAEFIQARKIKVKMCRMVKNMIKIIEACSSTDGCINPMLAAHQEEAISIFNRMVDVLKCYHDLSHQIMSQHAMQIYEANSRDTNALPEAVFTLDLKALLIQDRIFINNVADLNRNLKNVVDMFRGVEENLEVFEHAYTEPYRYLLASDSVQGKSAQDEGAVRRSGEMLISQQKQCLAKITSDNHLDMTIKSFVDEVLNLAVARVRCYVRPTEANSSNLSPV